MPQDDGVHIYLSDKFPLQNSSGEIYAVCGIATDITEPKRSEEKIKFMNVLLSTQQETSADGILVVDENGKILSYNQMFTDLWGIPSDVMGTRSDKSVLACILAQLTDPGAICSKGGISISEQESNQPGPDCFCGSAE